MPYKIKRTEGAGGEILILCATAREAVEAIEKFEDYPERGILVTLDGVEIDLDELRRTAAAK